MQAMLETLGLGTGVKAGIIKFATLGAMIGLSVTGSYVLKKAATLTELTTLYFSLGVAAWTISAACFVALLKTGPLGLWGPLAAVIQVAIVMVISAAVLNETFSTGQWIAMSIAVAAMGVSMSLSA